MTDSSTHTADNSLPPISQNEVISVLAAHGESWGQTSASLWSSSEMLSLTPGHSGVGQLAGTSDSASGNQLPNLQLGDFKAEALKVFDRLDPYHNGAVSDAQLAQAVQDPSITGNEAVALSALYSLKRDEENGVTAARENGGKSLLPSNVDANVLTRAEIENLPDSLPQAKMTRGMLETLDNPDVRASLDQNNDGRISAADLQNTPLSGFASSYEQLSSSYAANHLNPVEQAEVKANGLTFSELDGLLKEQKFLTTEAGTINAALKHADVSESAQQPKLFSDLINPLNSIKPDDVHQGLAGDCYFDSSLSSVAAKQPELIKNAIHENDNGTFTVTFPGDPQHPVTVPTPTETEMNTYNADTKDGIWPSVMEKAFADHQILFGGRVQTGETAEDATSSGSEKVALALLTGVPQNHIDRQYIDPRRDEDPNYNYDDRINGAMATLTNAASRGEYAVVGTRNGSATWENNLVPNHAYSVVGYKPGPDGGTFELRNPWGDASKNHGDYFSITGDKLARTLKDLTTIPQSS